MDEFFASIRRGDFRIPVCNLCKKKLWPPCQYCSSCFSKADLKRVIKKGILIEFTKSYLENTEVIFGVVEVCGIRLMGRLFPRSKELRNGMQVCMTECGINSAGRIFYNFEP
ncbi:MAG: hypothetical protein ACJ718_08935 [Nitrososphaeraceae archaeon]